MIGKQLDISLVIPAHNEEHYIGACLDSVHRLGSGIFREIIVVDNASSDRTADVAQAHGARVVREPRKGLTIARQSGFDATSGEWVAYIDADCILPTQWLAVAEKHIRKNPGVIALSGPLKYHDGSLALRALLQFLVYLSLPLTHYVFGYFITGGNFLVKRSAVKQIDGFDTNVVFHGEDGNLGRRLRAVGKIVFRLDFYLFTSSRRYREAGVMRAAGTYVLNYLWDRFLHRPYHNTYTDIR